jgi:hypothetical protein
MGLLGHVLDTGKKCIPGFGGETTDLEDVGIDENIILKWILGKYDGRA